MNITQKIKIAINEARKESMTKMGCKKVGYQTELWVYMYNGVKFIELRHYYSPLLTIKVSPDKTEIAIHNSAYRSISSLKRVRAVIPMNRTTQGRYTSPYGENMTPTEIINKGYIEYTF